MARNLIDEFRKEERPCGDCRHFREAISGYCVKFLVSTTRTMRVDYRVSAGTCFESCAPTVEPKEESHE